MAVLPAYAKDPLNPLQVALVAAIRGDAACMTALPGGVYDEPPERENREYLMLADALSVPDHTHDKFGREITQTFHIWSKSRGMKKAQDAMAAVNALLDHQNDALTVVGHRIVIIRNEFQQVLRDPDTEWRQGIMRFRIFTEQLED